MTPSWLSLMHLKVVQNRFMIIISRRPELNKNKKFIIVVCSWVSVLRTSARCDTCAAFPDALLLSLVMCHVHCAICTLLRALCQMHCAAFLADLEVLQACAEQMHYRSCPCMIATIMSSGVHTISLACCSLCVRSMMQPTSSQLDEVRMSSKCSKLM